jgi:ketosteroid isomerase-like protein
MKKIYVLLALSLSVCMAAAAQTKPHAAAAAGTHKATATSAGMSGEKAAVMALLKEFEHDFNTGDPGWMKLCADQVAIIDEFPPYSWIGSNACQKWSDDFDTDAKKNGITAPSVKFSSPRHLEVIGDRAYVVMPSEYDHTEKGKVIKEIGATLTVALQKVADGWRITAWTWSRNQ